MIIELSGGPNDGHRFDLPPEEATGRLEFHEQRHEPLDVTSRLLAGEVVPVSDWEHAGVIVHVYSRTARRSGGGAVVYEYVRVR